MRLTITAGPFELDVTFGIAGEAEDEDTGQALNGGTTVGCYVGFAPHVQSEEIPLPQRTPAWDEPEE